MSELKSSDTSTVLSSIGFHSDGWCEPICSARVRASRDLDVGTATIWIKPNEEGPDRARLAIQVDREDPFVFELEAGMPTTVGFQVNRPAGKVFAITVSCDFEVTGKGEDTRHLSFQMNQFELFSGTSVIADQQSPRPGEAPPFGKFLWTAEGRLRGVLAGADAGTVLRASLDGAIVAEASTDERGEFALEVGEKIAGHNLRWVSIVAGDVLAETNVNLLLDPAICGRAREEMEPPKPPVAPAVTYSGERQGTDQAVAAPAAVAANAGSGEMLAPLVKALTVQTQALRTLMFRQTAAGSSILASILAPASEHVSERFGEMTEEVMGLSGRGPDVIWLGVIDWDFRVQRPQHLAVGLARTGCRVFYVSIVFEEADGRGRFEIIGSPEFGVYEIRLRVACELPPNIYRRLDPDLVRELLLAIDEMTAVLSIHSPTIVVQYPSWAPVAFGVPGATVIHDCLDLVSGFSNTPAEIQALEDQLVADADVVVATSIPLKEHLAEQRDSVLLRNGADVDFFAAAAVRQGPAQYDGKVIGYFGAISDWYETDWIAEAAAAHPEWTFVLIGATDGADIIKLTQCANVLLLGERPYKELPEHLAQFDVAVIPFKLNDLIMCTNPVKLYEYMAAGKPVVASAMPEVVAATELAYIAESATDFVSKIEQALAEDNDALQQKRMEWAKGHDWSVRARGFRELIDARQPKVSVIILSYMNWKFTEATLRSVLAFSDYDNLEIIVVDNGSTPDVVSELKRFVPRDPRVRLILNGENLGYAAGNNVGLRAATGEYLILLNNDTYVTRGWVADLIRPLKLDPEVGLVSPTTNSIGNEQKIRIQYTSMEEMARNARSFVRRHVRERFETDSVAFFCAATRRDVVERVGMLDEEFGLGFFEDDDYCQRILRAGYSIQIVDDVFIHHHLSASFDKLPQEEKRALLERNKALFEKRWGTWKPHSYRNAPDFG